MAVFISSHVTWKLVIFKMHVYIYIHDEFKNSEQPFLELGTQAHHNPMKMISGHSKNDCWGFTGSYLTETPSNVRRPAMTCHAIKDDT